MAVLINDLEKMEKLAEYFDFQKVTPDAFLVFFEKLKKEAVEFNGSFFSLCKSLRHIDQNFAVLHSGLNNVIWKDLLEKKLFDDLLIFQKINTKELFDIVSEDKNYWYGFFFDKYCKLHIRKGVIEVSGFDDENIKEHIRVVRCLKVKE